MSAHPTVLVVVLDAVGKKTLEHYLSRDAQTLTLPNLESLGLGNILAPTHHSRIAPSNTIDIATTLEPASTWPDSTMGHRELEGFVDLENFKLFMDGFPDDYVAELERRINRGVIFNERAGGTAAIMQNHDEHMRTGSVILYASICDPIPQLAAHESVVPPDELARYTKIAFDLAFEMELNITRAISRPYVWPDGDAKPTRTGGRRDYVKPLPENTITFVDLARARGVHTVSVGKCSDVVNTTWDETHGLKGTLDTRFHDLYTLGGTADKNPISVIKTIAALRRAKDAPHPTFIMANLPDTDSLYGHERIIHGNLASLTSFDLALPMLLDAMPENSFLFVTADHGMRDPGDYGYHSREAVPLLGRGVNRARISDTIAVPNSRNTYGVVSAICANIFGFGDEFMAKCNAREYIPN